MRFLIDALRTAQLISQAIVLYNPIKLFLVLAALPSLAALGLLAYAAFAPSAVHLVAGSVLAASAVITIAIGFVADLLRKIALRARD